MSENIQVKAWTQSEPHPLSLNLSLFRFIAFGVLIGFSVLVIVTSVVAQRTSVPQRPFAAFSDVFPEQSGDGMEKKGFYCLMIPVTSISEEHCALQLANGAIAEVDAVISGKVIRQVEFKMRYSDVRLGDLMVFLGAPEVRRSGHYILFYWHDSRINATAVSDAPPSPYLALQDVSMASPWDKSFG